jgi:hypothetical protein
MLVVVTTVVRPVNRVAAVPVIDTVPLRIEDPRAETEAVAALKFVRPRA